MVNKKSIIILVSIIMIFSGCSAPRTTPSDIYLTKQQFVNEEEKFLIDEYELDESYTLLGRVNHPQISLNAVEEILPIGSFIGYDDKYVYIMHYDEDDALISRINYISKYIEKEIYRSSDMIFSCQLINNYLYIGESEIKEDYLLSTLKSIELKDNNNLFKEDVLFTNEYIKFPEISYSDTYVVINYVKDNSHIIGYINYDSNEFVEIYKSDFEVKDGFLYTGSIPLNASGTKDGIYFQLISLNNEELDFEGTQILYFYSFENNKCMPKLDLSDKITYARGDEDVVVINNYSVNDPRAQTGKIISLKDNTYIDIPGTRPANSINDSSLENNVLFITSLRNLYIYDLDKESFTSMDVNRDSSEIRIFKDTFGFIEKPKNKHPIFKIISYRK